jgi:glucose-1-phosphate thymidylyltransferase
MKGIILAGGSGTRLYPLTLVTSKQLLPVYDKPMIYYPLSVLMMTGIRDILIISTPADIQRFEKLLGNGKQLGISISYKVQEKPNGLATAFILGESFIGNDASCLILGDNIFYGNGLKEKLLSAKSNAESNNLASIFGYYVNDPERFGVVEFDKDGNVLSLEEKPKKPKSNYAATGLYFYPKGVSKIARKVVPSNRGEYEITTLNQMYLEKKQLIAQTLGRGFSWLDTGTMESLVDASNFIRMIEEHQSLKICCPEEIAFSNKWISKNDLLLLADSLKQNEYGQYLLRIANGGIIY